MLGTERGLAPEGGRRSGSGIRSRRSVLLHSVVLLVAVGRRTLVLVSLLPVTVLLIAPVALSTLTLLLTPVAPAVSV